MPKSLALQDLARRIQEIESHRLSRRPHLGLGIPALDGVFPKKGLSAGSLVELLSAAEGTGAWTLGLLMARQLASEKALVIIDGSRSFYPPAAVRLGVDLKRTILVCPKTKQENHAAMNLSLRCPAVGGVIAYCEQLTSLEFRRLQLAAETGAGVGFLLREEAAKLSPSFAEVRLLILPLVSPGDRQRVQVDVLRSRGTKNGQSLILEIDHETGDVRIPARLAAATPASRAARASG